MRAIGPALVRRLPLVLVLVLLTGVLAARGRPFRGIPAGALVLYFSNCRYSLATLAKLDEARAAGVEVVAVPIDGAPADEAAAACDRTLSLVSEERYLLELLPRKLACARLQEDATAFYRQHFSSTPAFSVGNIPVPGEALEGALSILGIEVRLAADGARLFARKPQTPKYAEPRATWTNQSLGW
jgi:hypothetical protein